MNQRFAALIERARALIYPSLTARADGEVERIRARYDAAYHGMYERARRAEQRGKRLSERARGYFTRAADNITEAERARRVAGRLTEILS